LLQIANEQREKKQKPLHIKKLFVLGGLLVEQYHETMKMTSRAKVKDKRGAMVTNF
jgi:WD repeat-containing protein 35